MIAIIKASHSRSISTLSCVGRMAASSDRSNILLYASTTLSVVTICLFVVSCCYFQSVINVQNERLVLLTDQQDSLKNEVTTLKRNQEQDVTVSYMAAAIIIVTLETLPRHNSLLPMAGVPVASHFCVAVLL